MERAARLQGIFLHISQIPNKNFPNERNFSLLSKVVGKECPSMFSLRKRTSISRALLSITFRVPSKVALSPGFSHRAPSERDAPFLELSFIHLSKYPVYEPPSRFRSGAPMERDACLWSLPLHILQGPQ